MEFLVFGERNKKIFSIFFGILFFALSFGVTKNVPIAFATIGASCALDSQCGICEKCSGLIGGKCYATPSSISGYSCFDAYGTSGVSYGICEGSSAKTYYEKCESDFFGNHSCSHNWVETIPCGGSTPACCQTGSAPDSDSQCKASCVALICNSNPTVTISPTSQSGTPGANLTYTMSVKNNDPAGCANTTFNLTNAGCPGGWTCNLGSASLNIAPQGNPSTFLTIQSVATASAGSSVVTVTATGASGNTGSATATYVVTAAGGITVTTSPSSIPASTDTSVTFFVKKPDATPASFADVSLSSGGGCNVGAPGFCTYTVNSASNVTVTAKLAGFPDGTAVITVAAAACVPATCVGCANGTPCPGGTCNGGVCVAGGGCGSLMCGAANATPCTCGGTALVGANVWCGFSPMCNPGQGFTTQAACQAACLAAVCDNDGTCDVGETIAGCPADCSAVCDNDGTCDVGETIAGCPADCSVVAACSGPGMFVSPLGPGYCTIGEILTNATNWILALVSSIIVLILIIGGLMYISSSGDEEKLRTSKNIIYYAVVGLGIILISYALITEVTNLLKGP